LSFPSSERPFVGVPKHTVLFPLSDVLRVLLVAASCFRRRPSYGPPLPPSVRPRTIDPRGRSFLRDTPSAFLSSVYALFYPTSWTDMRPRSHRPGSRPLVTAAIVSGRPPSQCFLCAVSVGFSGFSFLVRFRAVSRLHTGDYPSGRFRDTFHFLLSFGIPSRSLAV